MSNEVDYQVKVDMRNLYEGEKVSLKAVADKFGLSTTTVKLYIEDAGGTIRPKGRQPGFKVTARVVTQTPENDQTETESNTGSASTYKMEW